MRPGHFFVLAWAAAVPVCCCRSKEESAPNVVARRSDRWKKGSLVSDTCMDIQYASPLQLHLRPESTVLSVAESPPPFDTAAWLARLNDAQREAVEYGADNPNVPPALCW